MYQIIAAVQRIDRDGWHHVEQLPVFFLSPAIQGIISLDHAETIARDMISRLAPSGSVVAVAARFVDTPDAGYLG